MRKLKITELNRISAEEFKQVKKLPLVVVLACSFTGNVNNNAILGSSVVLVVLGLISYIVINKKIAD